MFSGAPADGHPRGQPLTEGRLPGQDPNLWVPLLAVNHLVEPESLAAALCGTASGGVWFYPRSGERFQVDMHVLCVGYSCS